MTPSPFATPDTGAETEQLLLELFPFAIVADESLVICGCGRLMSLTVPHLQAGESLRNHFEWVGFTPTGARYERGTWRNTRPVILKPVGQAGPIFKGQLYPHGQNRLYFLVWPVVARADDLVGFGIRLADIPPHNQLSDLLLVLRNSQLTLADANRLNAKAHSQLRELESLNVRLRGEAELIRARQAAEATSDAKSRFLSHVSHELRTPLNAMLGYSEMLVDGYYGDIPPTAVSVLERMQVNGRHLLDLINKILDMSVIEAGQLTLAVRTYDFRSTCLKVVAATEGLAIQKGLVFEADINPDLGETSGDELRVTQVLMNLVGNAIKFTSAGKISFFAWSEGDSVIVEVRDTGPGIAPQDQARIFKDFQQVKLPGGITVGAGLGLSIASKIVALHRGAIDLQSTPGEGSTFRLTLPRQYRPAPEL